MGTKDSFHRCKALLKPSKHSDSSKSTCAHFANSDLLVGSYICIVTSTLHRWIHIALTKGLHNIGYNYVQCESIFHLSFLLLLFAEFPIFDCYW